MPANAQRDEDTGFQYVATLLADGSVTYGIFTGAMSFELQAKPESVVINGVFLQNMGHSEVNPFITLQSDDSGLVTSSSLPTGTPVTLNFIVRNRSVQFISEPVEFPYPNGDYAGFSSGGYLKIFDEQSLNSFDPSFFQNRLMAFSFNTAVGNRVDLTAVNILGGYGYAGYIGVEADGGVLFYGNVTGTFDTTTEVFIEAPPTVAFTADSGHDYAPTGFLARSLGNISTRGLIGAGSNVMIGGFIVTGTVPKKVLLRVIGPSLTQFGVPDALADPSLELHGSDGALITSNDNWKQTQQAEVEATGIAPTNDLESAIIATLDPGAYTAIASSKNGVSGVGLVEVYDLDQTADAQLANISTRGFVGSESHVMIGGFILGGGDGDSAEVVVRALGPSLTPFGVTGALADASLELRNGNGDLIRANDNWKEIQQTEIEATGLQPAEDLEAAVFETLSPGGYTAIVTGKDGLTGVALVEIYRLP
ncbi:MAG: hypothetical protein H0T83_09665 [Chthoniobacterales bacterium]|nr:hypothetical protein [Chthoniobacterales bacterium]